MSKDKKISKKDRQKIVQRNSIFAIFIIMLPIIFLSNVSYYTGAKQIKIVNPAEDISSNDVFYFETSTGTSEGFDMVDGDTLTYPDQILSTFYTMNFIDIEDIETSEEINIIITHTAPAYSVPSTMWLYAFEVNLYYFMELDEDLIDLYITGSTASHAQVYPVIPQAYTFSQIYVGEDLEPIYTYNFNETIFDDYNFCKAYGYKYIVIQTEVVVLDEFFGSFDPSGTVIFTYSFLTEYSETYQYELFVDTLFIFGCIWILFGVFLLPGVDLKKFDW